MKRPRVMLNPSNQYVNQIFDESGKEIYNEGMNMYLIAALTQKILQQGGRVDAFISRNTQTQRTTLAQETDLTRALGCDILIAFHSDATGTDDPGGGTWAFYAGDESKKLAESVHSELLEAIKTFYPDVNNKGVHEHWKRLWVLHESGCPAALVEFLFHSNPKEREMLKNPNYQKVMAQAVADGILKYFGL